MKQIKKRGQTGGLITSLVFGIAALVIGTIIAFVIVSTLSGADLISEGRVSTAVGTEAAWINSTTYTLTVVDDATTNFVITEAANVTNGATINAANFTLDSTTGILTNATPTAWNDVALNYTYDTLTNEELSAGLMTGNFTSGINNVSSKLPTALLIAAIILILAILGVLVGVWQKMRMGGGSI